LRSAADKFFYFLKLNLETLEKRREDQDMSLDHKLASENIFSNTNVLKPFGTGKRTATRIASEPRNLVTQYARTELRKALFAV
jgi:hypothetical protein